MGALIKSEAEHRQTVADEIRAIAKTLEKNDDGYILLGREIGKGPLLRIEFFASSEIRAPYSFRATAKICWLLTKVLAAVAAEVERPAGQAASCGFAGAAEQALPQM